MANKKIRLLDVLLNYGLKIEKNPQRPTWSNNIICPLSSHKGANERTPSFGYCYVSDHAYCFGCKFTGRAVEFISLYENKPRGLVADKILAQYGDDVALDDSDDYQDDLSPILLDGSKYLQILIQKYKNDSQKLEYIDKLIWWLDFYIMQKAPDKNITASDLQYRINKIKELTDESFYTW